MLTRLIQITPGTEFTWMTESIIHCAVHTLCFLNETGVRNADVIQWFEKLKKIISDTMSCKRKKSVCFWKYRLKRNRF